MLAFFGDFELASDSSDFLVTAVEHVLVVKYAADWLVLLSVYYWKRGWRGDHCILVHQRTLMHQHLCRWQSLHCLMLCLSYALRREHVPLLKLWHRLACLYKQRVRNSDQQHFANGLGSGEIDIWYWENVWTIKLWLVFKNALDLPAGRHV